MVTPRSRYTGEGSAHVVRTASEGMAGSKNFEIFAPCEKKLKAPHFFIQAPPSKTLENPLRAREGILQKILTKTG